MGSIGSEGKQAWEIFLGTMLTATWLRQRLWLNGTELGLPPSSESSNPLPWPVHRLRMQSPGVWRWYCSWKSCHTCFSIFFLFISKPNLSGWWLKWVWSCLLGSPPGQGLSARAGVTAWASGAQAAGRVVIRLPVENWSGEEAVPAKSSFLSGSDSCGVPLNKPSYTWTFPVSHFFNTRKRQTLCTETYVQKANLFKLCNPP